MICPLKMKRTLKPYQFFLTILVIYFGASPVCAQRLIVLGTVQDAGSPHIGCSKACCKKLFGRPDPGRKVVSLGVIDEVGQKVFLIEATPDIAEQVKALKARAPFLNGEVPNGILLTHAHIGHYAGLMYLGREALGAREAPVYAMPGMKNFLENNGPWSQLVALKNISIQRLEAGRDLALTPDLKVRPFIVPHRDEFSETVGFRITGKNRTAIFLPDIDKWEKWGTDIAELLSTVDYAFLDATFYDAAEIGHRDIREIPHPFVIESMALLGKLPQKIRQKVRFIHFNHTNPLLNPRSRASRQVRNMGFGVSRIYDEVEL